MTEVLIDGKASGAKDTRQRFIGHCFLSPYLYIHGRSAIVDIVVFDKIDV